MEPENGMEPLRKTQNLSCRRICSWPHRRIWPSNIFEHQIRLFPHQVDHSLFVNVFVGLNISLGSLKPKYSTFTKQTIIPIALRRCHWLSYDSQNWSFPVVILTDRVVNMWPSSRIATYFYFGSKANETQPI